MQLHEADKASIWNLYKMAEAQAEKERNQRNTTATKRWEAWVAQAARDKQGALFTWVKGKHKLDPPTCPGHIATRRTRRSAQHQEGTAAAIMGGDRCQARPHGISAEKTLIGGGIRTGATAHYGSGAPKGGGYGAKSHRDGSGPILQKRHREASGQSLGETGGAIPAGGEARPVARADRGGAGRP